MNLHISHHGESLKVICFYDPTQMMIRSTHQDYSTNQNWKNIFDKNDDHCKLSQENRLSELRSCKHEKIRRSVCMLNIIILWFATVAHPHVTIKVKSLARVI